MFMAVYIFFKKGGDIMDAETLKKLVLDLELMNDFNDIEAGVCSVCCGVGDGGNSSSGC